MTDNADQWIHVQEPVIMSAGWESSSGGTVIARHEYKGLSKMKGALEDWVEKQNLEQTSGGLRRSSRLFHDARRREGRHIPGAYEPDEDEDM